MPLVVLATSVVMLGVAAGAVISGAWVFGIYLALAALVPWTGRKALFVIGLSLAVGGLGWCAIELLPALGGIYLQTPFGGSAGLFAGAAIVLAARLFALSTEAAARFARPEWSAGITASVMDPIEAVAQALRSPGNIEIDRAVVALAAAPPSAIPSGEADRRAFWINVYNALSAHANRGRRSTRFFDIVEVFRTTYEIAGDRLSLDDIEHGLLRAGAVPPATPWTRSRDPRRRWSVPLDPRIHFALNCGAASCPPIRVYSGPSLDAELEIAKESFLTSESSFNDATRTLETSRILGWYKDDFGGEPAIRRLVAEALGLDPALAASARLHYKPYNWKAPDDA
jgi:hypothetical protein